MAPTSKFTANLACALALMGCSRAGDANRMLAKEWQKPGWHYRFDGDRGAAIYRFGGKSQVYFMALCDRFPIFTLSNGAYDRLAKFYDISIDNRTWQRAIYWNAHGSALMIDDPNFAGVFARAKHKISFKVDGSPAWEFTPNPMLSRLVSDCRQHNKTR